VHINDPGTKGIIKDPAEPRGNYFPGQVPGRREMAYAAGQIGIGPGIPGKKTADKRQYPVQIKIVNTFPHPVLSAAEFQYAQAASRL
jgi:hypothetical protein